MTPKVPISESGTAMLGMMVDRTVRKKANTTRMTRVTESNRVISMSCTEARTVVVRSMTTLRVMAGEIAACSCGKTEYTWSTVSMILAPG